MMSSANEDKISPSFPVYVPLISSSCLVAFARTSNKIVKKSGELYLILVESYMILTRWTIVLYIEYCFTKLNHSVVLHRVLRNRRISILYSRFYIWQFFKHPRPWNFLLFEVLLFYSDPLSQKQLSNLEELQELKNRANGIQSEWVSFYTTVMSFLCLC